jgi:hypothetical protein
MLVMRKGGGVLTVLLTDKPYVQAYPAMGLYERQCLARLYLSPQTYPN